MASILSKLLGSISPKRVLVINFDYEYKGVSYHAKLAESLDCTFCKWPELSFTDGQVCLGDDPLTVFKFVLFGTVGPHIQYYTAALEYAQKQGIPCFSYGQDETAVSKVLESVRYTACGVPQPKTIIQVADPKAADKLIGALKLPLVTKIIGGSQGKGVAKHDTKEALVKELKARAGDILICQEALTASSDYRIFFIHDQVLYVDKRSASKKGEFRHNISLGGTKERVELEPGALAIAKSAQAAMGLDASGVDLIQDEPTGKWYVLEVNSAPQFSEPTMVINKLVNIIKSRI